MIKAGRSQEKMQKILKEETKIFEKVKKAVEAGKIKKGQSRDLILKKYGEPVVIISKKNNIEKWVYKPGYASHFDNIKAYLFFNEKGELKEIKLLNKD